MRKVLSLFLIVLLAVPQPLFASKIRVTHHQSKKFNLAVEMQSLRTKQQLQEKYHRFLEGLRTDKKQTLYIKYLIQNGPLLKLAMRYDLSLKKVIDDLLLLPEEVLRRETTKKGFMKNQRWSKKIKLILHLLFATDYSQKKIEGLIFDTALYGIFQKYLRIRVKVEIIKAIILKPVAFIAGVSFLLAHNQKINFIGAAIATYYFVKILKRMNYKFKTGFRYLNPNEDNAEASFLEEFFSGRVVFVTLGIILFYNLVGAIFFEGSYFYSLLGKGVTYFFQLKLQWLLLFFVGLHILLKTVQDSEGEDLEIFESSFYAPIREEILFRGIYFYLVNWFWVSVIHLDSLYFGIPLGTILTALLNADAFFKAHRDGKWFHHWLLGLALSYAYIATGSLWASIAMHMIWNFTLTLVDVVFAFLYRISAFRERLEAFREKIEKESEVDEPKSEEKENWIRKGVKEGILDGADLLTIRNAFQAYYQEVEAVEKMSPGELVRDLFSDFSTIEEPLLNTDLSLEELEGMAGLRLSTTPQQGETTPGVGGSEFAFYGAA